MGRCLTVSGGCRLQEKQCDPGGAHHTAAPHRARPLRRTPPAPPAPPALRRRASASHHTHFSRGHVNVLACGPGRAGTKRALDRDVSALVCETEAGSGSESTGFQMASMGKFKGSESVSNRAAFTPSVIPVRKKRISSRTHTYTHTRQCKNHHNDVLLIKMSRSERSPVRI